MKINFIKKYNFYKNIFKNILYITIIIYNIICDENTCKIGGKIAVKFTAK